MSPPIVSSIIQQKFVKLFQAINIFFSGDQQLQDKDSVQLTFIRTTGLELAKEAASPQFDRFLTYLLGNSDMLADYPLQAVRMLCLMAKALQGEPLSPDQAQEHLTAALLADTGFRPAWLGHHGSHYDITAYQLRSLGLAWFTPGLETLIARHHSPQDDASAFRILSHLAQYLGMVYGTGIEEASQPLLSPAKTMETLMADLHPEANTMRVLLKTLSAFPIGSWVQLSSGQAALVIGSGLKNPLRPKVGLYRGPTQAGGVWEEFDLEKKPTVHITGELAPTETQRTLLNFPELLIPGWIAPPDRPEAPRKAPAPETINSAGVPTARVIPANLKGADDYHRFLQDQNRPPSARGRTPLEPARPSPGAWNVTDLAADPSMDKRQLLKFYRDELSKLRMTWEQQVRAAEQVTSNLKSPLLESYRRENELMAAMLERLEAIEANVSTPEFGEAATAPERGMPPPQGTPSDGPDIVTMDIVHPATVVAEETAFGLSEEASAGLQQIHERLASFKGQVDKDQKTLTRVKEQFRGTLAHLESREFQTLPSLVIFARQWQEKLAPMEQALHQTEEETAALTEEWNNLHAMTRSLAGTPRQTLRASWKDQIRPRMQKVLEAAQKALTAHHRRLAIHEEMIDRFCTEARRLAS